VKISSFLGDDVNFAEKNISIENSGWIFLQASKEIGLAPSILGVYI
jgi:hypothetical protein